MLKKFKENNKILIISHSADIDGLGSIILANYYFKEFDYLLANNNDDFSLDSDIDYQKYDTIYICDLGFNEKNLNYVLANADVATKIKHFDHHESGLKNNIYSFVNEKTTLNNRPTCATELFYEYFLKLDNNSILDCGFFKELVEAIRCEDTWTFKENNNQLGPDLTILLVDLGIEQFIEVLSSLDPSTHFYLPKMYEAIITRAKNIQNTKIENYLEKSMLVSFKQYTVAVSVSEEYRSLAGERLLEKYPAADFALIINFSRCTCSLRGRKNSLNLNDIAPLFTKNGGGHECAAGFSFDNESIHKINGILLEYLQKNAK